MAHIDAPPGSDTIDLLAGEAPGTTWRTAGEDLDAMVQAWPAGHEVAEHVHDEVDVFVVVLDGAATAFVDGVAHPLRQGNAILITRGSRRGIHAGASGVRLLKVMRHKDA